jgi:hypothetical protein
MEEFVTGTRDQRGVTRESRSGKDVSSGRLLAGFFHLEANTNNGHQDRFLLGTNEVAPKDQQEYLRIYEMYAPLLALLTPDASKRLRLKNYERLL